MTLPLTHDCPWHCTYCGYRTDNEGLISEAELERRWALAEKQGAKEILILSGEIPDTLPHLRRELAARGFDEFIEFTVDVCQRSIARGFLPHTNIGALSEVQLARLRPVNVSMGLMLENIDDGFNRMVAPEKSVQGRIKTIEAAGRLKIPYTSGLLIGLGESRESRLHSLDALAELHARYGHLQEIILQNYIPNHGSRLTAPPAPTLEEYFELIAHWRKAAPDVAIQIPPNLNPFWKELLPYIDDLGGISNEGDEVNPDTPWERVERYRDAAEQCGRKLQERLPVYERFQTKDWLDKSLPISNFTFHISHSDELWDWPLEKLREEADALNQEINGDVVSYVVNRNANFTNVCNVGCAFCGFQRKRADADAYTRTPEEVVERVASTPHVSEVCMQGGIHPDLPFSYYLELVRALKAWKPSVHLHAFSPMEIHSLHEKTGWSYEKILSELRDAGLNTIPGTAAEILDDDVRARISSRKLNSGQWIEIIRTAHRVGLRSTATVMFGHVETWDHLRAHFETLRRIQDETGGFTELVPLMFIPHENPLGHDIRPDPVAVAQKAERLYPLARLYFGRLLPNLQTSWVKLGDRVAVESLHWGCNDFGGTLYEESITRSSGGQHGEARTPDQIEALIRSAGKIPRERTTLYQSRSEDHSPSFAH
jgi:FO synthase